MPGLPSGEEEPAVRSQRQEAPAVGFFVVLFVIVLVRLTLRWRRSGQLERLQLTPVYVCGLLTFLLAGSGVVSMHLTHGTLRGLTSLAAANVLWFLLLVLGGVLFPLSHFGGTEPVVRLLPTASLADGLRQVLQHGAAAPLRDVIALCAWAVAALTSATRFFRWE